MMNVTGKRTGGRKAPMSSSFKSSVTVNPTKGQRDPAATPF